MKKVYMAPEFEVLKCIIEDVILVSKEDTTLPEVIGGGGGEETPIDDWW